MLIFGAQQTQEPQFLLAQTQILLWGNLSFWGVSQTQILLRGVLSILGAHWGLLGFRGPKSNFTLGKFVLLGRLPNSNFAPETFAHFGGPLGPFEFQGCQKCRRIVPENKHYTEGTNYLIGLQNNLHPWQHTFGNVDTAAGNCQQRHV
jgi:hypothetical protein